MSYLFPAEVQTAILFDRLNPFDLDALVRKFFEKREAAGGYRYNIVENRPGAFCMFFGLTDDLMISVELINEPANASVFDFTLGSAYTRMMVPDAKERIARCKSHALVKVRHGALPNLDSINDLIAKLGVPQPGNTLAQFQERLLICGGLSHIISQMGQASLLHWTQSNQLVRPEVFAELTGVMSPGIIHVHPMLFGGGESKDGKPQAEIITLAARHFIGREIRVPPSPIDWADNLETILVFLRVATAKNGYIVPDGDTFSTEDGDVVCLVRHMPVEEGKIPIYEIEPLLHRKSGFVAPGYLPTGSVINDKNPPTHVVNVSTPGGSAVVQEWREKRRMAEGIGGELVVRVTEKPTDSGWFPWLRKVVGRR